MTAVDDLIPAYLQAIEVEGKTPSTIKSYANSLAHFRTLGAELQLPDHVEEYRVEDVYRFLTGLKERGASARFRQRRQCEIRAFFSWCRRMTLIPHSVFAQVPLPKVEQKIREPFSVSDVQQMLGHQDRQTHLGARNYALVLFLLDTGLRQVECAAVSMADVSWEERRVLVRAGKGQKQRIVGMSVRTAEALEDYIERFRGRAEGPLFLTTRWQPLRKDTALHQIISRLGTDAGVPHAFPHRFRHTFATWAITGGAREIDVQMLLGHTTPVMTQRYARTFTSAQAVTAHEQLSPVRMLEGGSDAAVKEDRGAGPLRLSERRLPIGSPALTLRPPFDWRRVVSPGLVLVGSHRGAAYSCRVVAGVGALAFLLDDGRQARSASGAARLVTGYETNGYRFWQPADLQGEDPAAASFADVPPSGVEAGAYP